jgi:hypothetical protein
MSNAGLATFLRDRAADADRVARLAEKSDSHFTAAKLQTEADLLRRAAKLIDGIPDAPPAG